MTLIKNHFSLICLHIKLEAAQIFEKKQLRKIRFRNLPVPCCVGRNDAWIFLPLCVKVAKGRKRRAIRTC